MPDVFSKSKRSEVMSRIRSRGNKDTELVLRGVFPAKQNHRLRRRHLKIQVTAGQRRVAGKAIVASLVTRRVSLAVRPDFVFPKLKLAVFVDGCFWHGCPKHGTQPKGNAAFWRKKISGNRTRDRRVNRELRKSGWRVLRIWEHALPRTTKRPQLLG